MASKTQDAAPRAASDSALKTSWTRENSSQTDAVQVAVRVRPLIPSEASLGSETCVDVVDASVILAEKQFDFDAAFPATAQQVQILHFTLL